MTNKEKFLQKIANKKSKAIEQAKWRNANREWLRESQKLAVIILLELDKKSMKQKELAEAIGKSPQYVNKLLRGNEKFGFEVLVKIQNALGVALLSTFEPRNFSQTITFENKESIRGGEYIPTYPGRSKVIDMSSYLTRKEISEHKEIFKYG